MGDRVLRTHITNALLGIIYAIIYNYVYMNFMSKYYSGMYCPEAHWTDLAYYLYVFVSALPMLFYKGEVSISSGISFFVYVLVYVPMQYSAFISPTLQSESQILVIAVLLLVMLSFFVTDTLFLYKKPWIYLEEKKIPFEIYELFVCFIIIFVLVIEGSNLQFVNFLTSSDLLYSLRAHAGEKRSLINGYLICWSKGAFLPILLICYLRNRMWTKYILSVFGFIIIYMLDLQKNTLVMPFIISFVFIISRKKSFRKWFQLYVISFFSIISLLLIKAKPETTIFTIAALFIMRTQCLDSWLFTSYLDFFESHQFTYYTHISFVNYLTEAYPYSEVLGRVVTDGRMNANASFLITDGYAALGSFGIIIIGFVTIYLKSILNSISYRYNREDLLVIMFPATLGALNASIFTAILTSGFLILFLSLRFVDLRLLENDISYDE